MQRNILILLSFFLLSAHFVVGQDLPPATSNFQTIQAGSYIIPMDEEKQSVIQNDPFVGGNFTGFNQATYGLVYRLLDNGIPVKWVIRAGKQKDGADFTALVRRIYPGSLPQETVSFVSSAFVIDLADVITSSCTGGVNSLALVNQIITGYGRNVTIYELGQDTDLDVRYQLTSPPRIAILNDGEWAEAHFNLLDDANIPYTVIGSQEFFDDFSCYTFISQPHLEVIDNPDYIPSLNEFLNNGGNFIAQCSAVETFEDAGLYMTSTGMSAFLGNCGENQTYTYSNADMAINQFEGDLVRDIFGTISSFFLPSGGNWSPNSFEAVRNQQNKTVVRVADVNGAVPGGNIFYFGGHEWSSTFIGFCDPFSLSDNDLRELVQLRRIYFNTLFIPSSVSFACAGNDQCICPGGSAQLGCDNLIESPGITYEWTPAAGLSCTNCPNPIATPDVTTTYTLNISSGWGPLVRSPLR